jgi:hypothetical protein
MANLATVKIKGLPEFECPTTFKEWLVLLETYLEVTIPESVGAVVVSVNPPAENDRTKVWFRVDNSSSFIGIYVYTGGSWQKIYPLTGQVFWCHGSSLEVDPGFKLIDENNPEYTAAEANFFKALYLKDPLGGDFYTYFAVSYVGF